MASIDHTQQKYEVRPGAREFPMMVVVSFVFPCNAKCPHCPFTHSETRSEYADQPFIGVETFKRIAEECGKYGSWVRLTGGGEPTLHPQGIELIEYAKSVGAKVGLITNGSKMTEGYATRLLRAGVDMIEFSVDAADRETYGIVRKGLSWDTLLKNVTKTIELRNELQSTSRIIASGINQVGVDIDSVATFWEKIVDVFQKRKFLTYGTTSPEMSADPEPYLPPEEQIPCPYLFERLNIDTRGTIYLCAYDSVERTTDMGNVNSTTIKDVWNGAVFEHYRKMHLEKRGNEMSPCNRCEDWKFRSWQHNYWKLVDKAQRTTDTVATGSIAESIE